MTVSSRIPLNCTTAHDQELVPASRYFGRGEGGLGQCSLQLAGSEPHDAAAEHAQCLTSGSHWPPSQGVLSCAQPEHVPGPPCSAGALQGAPRYLQERIRGIPLSPSAWLWPCHTARFIQSVWSRDYTDTPGHLQAVGRHEYKGAECCVHPVYLLAVAPSGTLCRQTRLSLPGRQWLCSEPSPQAQEVEEASAESMKRGTQSCCVMRGPNRSYGAAYADLFPLFWALESIAKGCLQPAEGCFCIVRSG